jgi:hypothetical protein
VQQLGYHEFVEIGRVARRAMEQKQVMVNNIAVRRGAERLAQCEDWHEMIEALQDTFANNDFDYFKIVVKAQNSGAVRLSYQWQRPVMRCEKHMQPSEPWMLSLGLKVLKGKWDGSLELSRMDSSALLLDINLLTSELRGELERACARAIVLAEDSPRPAVRRAFAIPNELDAQRLG